RKRRHHALVERVLLAGTDRVVVSAQAVGEFYLRQIHASPSKVDVIYNAVDFERLQTTLDRRAVRESIGVPIDAEVAGVIARLTGQKGHRYLFEALTNPALAHVHLVVVGDGHLRAPLQREAELSGIA